MLGYVGLFQAYILVSATSTLQHHCKLLKMAQQREKLFKWQKKPKQYTEHRHSPKLKTDFHDQDISPTFGQFRDIWPGFPDKRVYARRSRAISSLIISLVPSMM